MYQLDLQKDLLAAFEARNITKFKKYLEVFNKTVIHSNDSVMNIFEKVLSTKDCFTFVKVCVDAGCDVNYVNSKLNKAAINYALDSVDSRNLGALLFTDCLMTKVNVDYLYEGETPLITLCKKVCPENVENTFWSIRCLISYNASPNIPDREGKTPLCYLIQNEELPAKDRSKIICKILTSQSLSEKNYRCGLDFVLQNNPDGKEPFIYPALVRHVLSLSSDDILNTLAHWQKNISNWNNRWMQLNLIEYCNNKSVENAFLNLVKENNEEDNLELLKLAVMYKKPKIALSILKTCQLSTALRSELQKNFIWTAYNVRSGDEEDYKSCLKMLIDERFPPLEHLMELSFKHTNSLATQVLLRHGAKFKGDNYDISEIEFKDIEEQLNNCISKQFIDRNKISLDFQNLVNEQNEIEMENIFRIAQKKELRPLLKHPLIDFIMGLQWMRSINIYFVHFLILIIFNILLLTQVCLRFSDWYDFAYSSIITYILCAFIILFLLVDVILSYLTTRSLAIFKDIVLIILLILTCIETDFQRVFAIFAIMLLTLKLTFLIGGLPFDSLSTHMLMLEEVTNTFTKVIAQYSIFLIIYALCFYVLFASPDSTNLNSSFNKTSSVNETNSQIHANQTKPEEDDMPFLTLSNLSTTLPKTLTMFLGQYNVEKDFTSHSKTLILILFMFLAMILTNLLSALAIHDTQNIQSQAETNGAICRLNLLKRYGAIMNISWGEISRLQQVIVTLVNRNECTFNRIIGYYKLGASTLIAYNNDVEAKCLYPKGKCFLHSGKIGFNEVGLENCLEIIKVNGLNAVKESSEENINNQFENISTLLQNQFTKKFEQLQNTQGNVAEKLVLIQEESEKRLKELSTKLALNEKRSEEILTRLAFNDKRSEELSTKLDLIQEQFESLIAMLNCKAKSS